MINNYVHIYIYSYKYNIYIYIYRYCTRHFKEKHQLLTCWNKLQRDVELRKL